MSNFLKNLARRGAGLPLSTECFPTPSPALQPRFGSRERSQEIAFEETSDFRPEAPLATPPQPINASTTLSTPEVQRSTAITPGTPSPPSVQDSSTILQPSSPGPGPFSSQSITSSLRPDPRSIADALEIAQATDSDRTDKTLVKRHEVNEHGVPTVAQTVAPLRHSTRVESNLQGITWGSRERPGLMRPEAADGADEGTAQNKREAPAADQMIRPAATEPRVPFPFPKMTPALAQSPATVPIHVRIGRVEVRGNAPHEPARSTPKESPPIGFAGYQRMRRYRN